MSRVTRYKNVTYAITLRIPTCKKKCSLITLCSQGWGLVSFNAWQRIVNFDYTWHVKYLTYLLTYLLTRPSNRLRRDGRAVLQHRPSSGPCGGLDRPRSIRLQQSLILFRRRRQMYFHRRSVDPWLSYPAIDVSTASVVGRLASPSTSSLLRRPLCFLADPASPTTPRRPRLADVASLHLRRASGIIIII